MTVASTLIFVGLVACAHAAMRTLELRKQARECATSDASFSFPRQIMIEDTFPSAAVQQTDTDVANADLISIKYGPNFKVLTEKMSKEVYVLTQCGTTQPTTEEINSVRAVPAGYTVKHFTIPLLRASSSGTTHLAFFKELGVEDRIMYISEYAVDPCWQKTLGCGGKHDSSNLANQIKEVEALFTDCSYDGTCDNVNGEPKAIHISASHDTSPLRKAEHIKFIAAFFNKEDVALAKFSDLIAAYKGAAVARTPKPVVAWISSEKKSQWGPAKLKLSAAKYKLEMVKDVGAANVNGTAVMDEFGPNMSVAEAASGNTYSVNLADYNDNLTQAGHAFVDALGQVDVLIDETYDPVPTNYTHDTFLANFGLTEGDTHPWKKVLRIDGDISESSSLDWYESRLAHPEWALQGLARQIFDDNSKTRKYFRDIAAGQTTHVLTKAMCTEALPRCNANAYATAIVIVALTQNNTPTHEQDDVIVPLTQNNMPTHEQDADGAWFHCLGMLTFLTIGLYNA